MKLNSTPPAITRRRCQAGLERNSHGCGSCLSISVSMDSSIIPLILQYPPNGSQPIPYSVSLSLNFGNSFVNHLEVLVLNSLTPPASKKRKNLSTRIPKMRAKKKCPNSCIAISTDKAMITCSTFINIAILLYCFARRTFLCGYSVCLVVDSDQIVYRKILNKFRTSHTV